MNIVADLGHFLKPLNGLIRRINLLLIDIYNDGKPVRRGPYRYSRFHSTEAIWERSGRPKIKLFLEGKEIKSNAHGHDDVAIAVGLVGERAHLAGGLFVF
jgi:hypothetical protein